jgi:hypothetical protein
MDLPLVELSILYRYCFICPLISAQDDVTLGGITIQNQAVECAKKVSSSFSSGAGDGLFGLVFNNINSVHPTPVATPVQNMGAEGVIPQVLFYLTPI